MAVLHEILEHKRSELRALRSISLPPAPALRAVDLRRKDRLNLIAEIKLRSPSAGPLSTRLGVAERARCYADAGADVISVLTDARFFDGAFAHLTQARDAQPLPVLCKDFVIDESQLDAARAFGADLVLLIVRCLAPSRLAALVRAAKARGLAPLVEIGAEEEAKQALDAGAELVGVNARDLDTLQMDVARAARLLGLLPPEVTRAHLSGLATPEDVRRVAGTGVDAALIGEALMRCDDPSELLAAMRAAAG